MKAEESLDALLGGRVRIAQPANGYRAAIDPVLLAASIPDKGRMNILDVGCGDGGATLCLAWRLGSATLHGLDLRPGAVGRLKEAIAANGFGDRVTAQVHDVGDGPLSDLENKFDWVVSNPPFLPAERADRRDQGDASRVETLETVPLGSWIDFMLRCVRHDGWIAMIHRADRIDDILAGLHGKAGGVVVAPLWPRAGTSAKRVLVHARRNARSPARVHPGLSLHDESGEFTRAARAILSDGAPLDLS